MQRIKSIFLLLITTCFALPISAQGAAEVWLKKAASKFEQKGVDLSFRINEDGIRLNGKLLIEGEKFSFHTDEMKIWYDGTTQWTLQTDDDYSELYISEPTPEEQQGINPYLLLGSYQEHFTAFDEGEKNINGQLLHMITLKAKDDQQELSKLTLYIYGDGTPAALILTFPDNRKYKIEVQSFRNGLTFPQQTFTYQEKEYPVNEKIDMR